MRPYRHFNYPDYGFDERQSDEHSPDFGILSYDLDMKTLRSFLPPDERKRNCVAFSADGELMALGTDDGEVEVWNVSQRIRNDTIKIGATAVRCCTFSPDGAILAAGMSDGRLATINLVADRGGRQLELRDAVERISQPEHIGEFCRIRLAHDGPVTCLGFLKNGFRLFSGGADGDVKVWDLLLALETQYRCTAGVLTATKHPRQEELLIGDRGGHVYFLKYESVVDETSPPPCGQ
jgi:WD40 repeat protein